MSLLISGCASAPITPNQTDATAVVFDQPVDTVEKAAVEALRSIGCEITKQGSAYVEGIRPFRMGWSKSEGGETVGVWLESVEKSTTNIRVATGISYRNKAGQKFWDYDVVTKMRMILSPNAAGDPEIRQATGKVYIFNVSRFEPLGLAHAVAQEITGAPLQISEGGQVLATVPKGTYRIINLHIGKHELWAELPAPGRSVLLNVEEGQSYYISVRYSSTRSWAWPIAGDPIEIKQISHEEAIALEEMKPQ